MAKNILKLDTQDQFDFVLAGIVCQHKDYRLCHELNRSLSIELSRQGNYELQTPRQMKPSSFPMFSYDNEDGDLYYLFANKGKNDVLIPEQKQMDFFLMVRESVPRMDVSAFISTIRGIPIVLGVYLIDVKTLKSREHFLF